jgi:hypothetical protein
MNLDNKNVSFGCMDLLRIEFSFRMTITRCIIALLVGLLSAAGSASAQLRPLDPIDFHSFSGEPLRVQVGMGLYFDQHASLAGTQGRLWELGDVHAWIRTGRIVMELSGTLHRRFDDEVVVSEPHGGALAPPTDGKRRDAGDYRVSTVLRLTSDRSPTLATLRFGTRLPTTDNRVGLDRDVTDFFATVGGYRVWRTVSVGVEAGLGINGTREASYEQADVFVYALTSELNLGRLTPFVMAVGQQDFHDWVIRGNEDLGEIRAGVRVGQHRWLNAAWVHGLSDSSPSNGLQISAGLSFGAQ